jgi:hypothetical protein
MIGAAALGRVDGRGPLVQWRVLPLMRNVAVAVLLRHALPTRIQSEGRLSEAVWVWTLAWGTPWAGHLWGLKHRAVSTRGNYLIYQIQEF